MKFGGLNCVGKPNNAGEMNSPDCRNEIIAGNRLKTRLGITKVNTIALPNPINFLLNVKSGFCKENYKLAIDRNGQIIIDPENYWEDYWSGYTAITNCVELQAIQNDLTGKYYLANDIDCTYCTQDPGGACYNGGAGFAPIGIFTGTFDGNGHTITGLKINRPSTCYVGLFSQTSGATIKNVSMIDVNISGGSYTGGLIGYAVYSSVITNCYSTGSVNGLDAVGGLIGYTNTSTVTNCYATNSVAGGDLYIGGLIGYAVYSSVITNCYSAGSVSGSYTGGLIGYNYISTVTNSFWDTETSGQGSSAGGTGKTTAQMKQQATFTNWDFSDIWNITEDVTYPWLR